MKSKTFQLTFVILFQVFAFVTQGQIFEAFSKIISPSSDTSNWQLVTVKKLNCSFKLPGKPVFDLEYSMDYEDSVPLYTISYESAFLSVLSFEVYSTHFPVEEIHSDSMDNEILQAFYQEQMDLINFGGDENFEIKATTMNGYPAVTTDTRYFDLVNLNYTVLLVKNQLYTFSVYYDDYPKKQIPYFLNSFKILEN